MLSKLLIGVMSWLFGSTTEEDAQCVEAPNIGEWYDEGKYWEAVVDEWQYGPYPIAGDHFCWWRTIARISKYDLENKPTPSVELTIEFCIWPSDSAEPEWVYLGHQGRHRNPQPRWSADSAEELAAALCGVREYVEIFIEEEQKERRAEKDVQLRAAAMLKEIKTWTIHNNHPQP